MNHPSSTGAFAVIGNPVAHSLSPQIHAAFGREASVAIDYRRLQAAPDSFVAVVDAFFAAGGRGLNVTLPFKRAAHALCGDRLGGAARSGAVNWLAPDEAGIRGDNTDGVGLVRDLERLVGANALTTANILLIGAGGAARGVVTALRAAGTGALVVAARDVAKAQELVDATEVAATQGNGFDVGKCDVDRTTATGLDDLDDRHFDVVINATSASLAGAALVLPPSVFAGARLVYDMMYAARPTSFLVDAQSGGARQVADGLGMLVEQAAESFRLWHGVLPAVDPVLRELRQSLVAAAA